MSRRLARRWMRAIPLWAWAVALVLVPICALNLAVGYFGDSEVSTLSPFFLGPKLQALLRYALHRPLCLLSADHAPLEPLAASAARKHGLPPGLLEAVVSVESSGHVHRISRAGAMGPSQLIPSTADQLKVDDPFDPAEAMDASARYLKAQLARFRDVRLAVAAYNAGAGAVNGAVPVNGETEIYVEKVMAEYARRRPPERHRQKSPAASLSRYSSSRRRSPSP